LGSYLTGAAGLCLIIANLFFNKFEEITKDGIGKKIKYVIYGCVAFGAITFLGMCGAIFLSSTNMPESGREAVVVLGAGLRGSEVSLTLGSRLKKAAEYLEENPDTVVIVSGGQGPGETVTEAFAMKNYLMAIGIDESRILTEDKSTSTYENFNFSKTILDEHFGSDEYKIVYVTNDFHCPRAGIYAKRAGFDGECLASETPPYLIPSNYSREYLALAWALVSR
ncbi:YdcF family protein, partial [Tyzzerella sp. OttesenSCG-928-J15]|nr:YdcF family protein [Tyzzerella sp. OttesenSCG-928-J15]